MDKFREWFLQEVGMDVPMPGNVAQDRQPHLVRAGLPDTSRPGKKVSDRWNDPMRLRGSPTSAFQTGTLPGSDPLPGNKKFSKK